mmetsp:Transcript_5092/g.8887  ORF Transcript_5092/g.8887 Transcript_5092/m.8887 type:complete len:98 (-) Transcript_5092:711-1004(-)
MYSLVRINRWLVRPWNWSVREFCSDSEKVSRVGTHSGHASYPKAESSEHLSKVCVFESQILCSLKASWSYGSNTRLLWFRMLGNDGKDGNGPKRYCT